MVAPWSLPLMRMVAMTMGPVGAGCVREEEGVREREEKGEAL